MKMLQHLGVVHLESSVMYNTRSSPECIEYVPFPSSVISIKSYIAQTAINAFKVASIAEYSVHSATATIII